MITLSSIISTRRAFPLSFWHIVWEWEDILSDILHVPIEADSKYKHIIKKNRFIQSFLKGGYKFVFDMNPWYRIRTHGIFKVPKNTIPYIIDFYLTDKQIDLFIKMYEDAKIIFISSREVYDYLRSKHTELNIRHLPVSLSDKYHLSSNTSFNKEYDVVLLGRLSPSMNEYLTKYTKKNPTISVLRKKIEDGHFNYYDENGNYVGNADNREDYMALMRKTRIILYSTPGYDGEKSTNGFSQVTPRFLEAISCGCHVIMKYPNNSDTLYFDLSKFSESVESFKQFEKQMDKALTTQPDLEFYADYLQKHYTSQRAKELKNILENV